MLDNFPREQLCFIIEQYGRSIIDDPRRCRGMLKDLAPLHQRETNLLVLALEQKVVTELTQKNSLTPLPMQLDLLAQRLHDNIGIQKDFAMWAIESWALALGVSLKHQENLATDLYREALEYYKQNDYKKALPLFEKLAEQGHSDAQNYLGTMYRCGHAVKQDYKVSVYWYNEAVDHDNAAAQCNLGWMYANGQGVEKNDVGAVFLYREAAEQGNARGQCHLGWMYTNGHGVKQDYTEAIYWFSKAAEQDNAEAQYYLGFMYLNGNGVQKDDHKAIYWYDKAATKGQSYAIQALELMQGEGQADAINHVNPNIYKLGDTLSDGSIVFHVDNSGIHGLVAQPKDESTRATWDQAMNLVRLHGQGWHLPTKDELTILFAQKLVVGGFSNSYYWSSSEFDNFSALLQGFNVGDQTKKDKDFTLRVRAVRAF